MKLSVCCNPFFCFRGIGWYCYLENQRGEVQSFVVYTRENNKDLAVSSAVDYYRAKYRTNDFPRWIERI